MPRTKSKPDPEALAVAAAPVPEQFPTFSGGMIVSDTALAAAARVERGLHHSPAQFSAMRQSAPTSEPVYEVPAGLLPVWTEADGPVPHVFANRPAGHRCSWAWKWATGHRGLVLPERSMPLEHMSPLQKFYELRDYYDRASTMENIACGDLLRNFDPSTGLHPRPDLVDQRLRLCRARVGESLAHWDLPRAEQIKIKLWRRGWQPADTAGHVVSF